MREGMRIAFPHIPKTGGTSLLYHFRSSIGDDSICVVGANNRVRLFFERMPQFEEMSETSRLSRSVFQGHGLDQNVCATLPSDSLSLLVVLRHPVGLTRSRYNQNASYAERAKGLTLDTASFMKKEKGDSISNMLVRKFSGFIENPSDPLLEQVEQILKCFNYVFLTEEMTEQVRPVFDYLGLPVEIERKRVAEKKKYLEVEDNELLELNKTDLAIFNKMKGARSENGRLLNPLGFDLERRNHVLNSILASRGRGEEILHICYEDLAKGLCSRQQAEAALYWLNSTKNLDHVKSPSLLKKVLQEKWDKASGKLPDHALKISEKNLARRRKILNKK